MAADKVGIWLIGARGGISTTVAVGLAALRRKLTEPVGLLTSLPPFSELNLLDWDDVVLGGHDIRGQSLVDAARAMHEESHVFSSRILSEVADDLQAVDANIRPGTLWKVGATIEGLSEDDCVRAAATPREVISNVRADLEEFAQQHGLARVIVVNVASTEPTPSQADIPAQWEAVESTLDDAAACPLPASSLYAIAAFEAGCPYINFTPSLGSTPAAISQLATQRGGCHIGYDGKTGETLLKSVLAPMFARRNLQVMSWVGHNIFGNMDGRVLDDPVNKQSKVTSKDRLLGEILGYDPQTHVSIEYIRSLGDWKTAWDHIHFQGFLQTPMVMQFTWQGCDSLLAAPLVLDLVRFVDCSLRRGEVGVLGHLACFFKSPLGAESQEFDRQFIALEEWAHGECRA